MNPLPSGWSTSTVGELCTLVNGRAFKPSEWGATGIPIIRIQNLNNPTANFNYFAGEVDDRHVVSPGELLFAWSGTPGTSFGAHVWKGERAALNQHIFRVLFDRRVVDRDFLKSAINQRLESLIDQAHGGVGLRHVTKGKFEATAIDVPPLAEQRRIVAKLGEVLGRTARVQKELHRVPKLLSHLRQAVLTSALSGDLSMDLGEPADQWPRLAAQEVCEKVQSGGTPKDGFPDAAGVPFLKVYNLVDQRVDFGYRPQFVSRLVHERELGKSCALPGDVVMNIVGPPLGKVAIVPSTYEEWNINQALTLFRPSARITTAWLYLSLCEGAQIRSVSHETRGMVGQVNISLSQCRAFWFTVPSVRTQIEIARRVELSFAQIDKFAAEQARADRLLPRLEQALLAQAFRGELVPQDPNDEPAAMLLERIRAKRAAEPPRKRQRPVAAQAPTPRNPRPPAAMPKSRQDPDVKLKAYLARHLRDAGGSANVEDLFRRADLSVADFYKQLAWEVDAGHVREHGQVLEAA